MPLRRTLHRPCCQGSRSGSLFERFTMHHQSHIASSFVRASRCTPCPQAVAWGIYSLVRVTTLAIWPGTPVRGLPFDWAPSSPGGPCWGPKKGLGHFRGRGTLFLKTRTQGSVNEITARAIFQLANGNLHTFRDLAKFSGFRNPGGCQPLVALLRVQPPFAVVPSGWPPLLFPWPLPWPVTPPGFRVVSPLVGRCVTLNSLHRVLVPPRERLMVLPPTIKGRTQSVLRWPRPSPTLGQARNGRPGHGAQ